MSSVHFRVDKELVCEVQRYCELERSPRQCRIHRLKYSPEERFALAQRYLKQYPVLSVGTYAAMTGLGRTTARQELRRWADMEDSGIGVQGLRSHKVYVRK